VTESTLEEQRPRTTQGPGAPSETTLPVLPPQTTPAEEQSGASTLLASTTSPALTEQPHTTPDQEQPGTATTAPATSTEEHPAPATTSEEHLSPGTTFEVNLKIQIRDKQ